MDLVPDDKARGLKTPVWNEYKTIVNHAEGKEVSSCSCDHVLLVLGVATANGHFSIGEM